MKLLKSVFLGVLLLASQAAFKARSQEPLDRDLRLAIAQETARYYAEGGDKRNWNNFRPFIYSAERVARMFPMFPAANHLDRTLMFYCYGVNESSLHRHYVHVNVPGMKYSNGKVKFFSIDYGWVGVNEINVIQTYEIAKAIQRNRSISNFHAKSDFRQLLKGAKIPENIKLKKIDLSTAKQAKKDYVRLLKQGKSPKEIWLTVKVPFREDSMDDIDSMLIYRVIEELERYNLGWPYETYNRELYDRLGRFVEERK